MASSAKEMHILNQWIDWLKEKKKYDCLKDMKDFMELLYKSQHKMYTSFGEFSSDIDILIRNAERGKWLCLSLLYISKKKLD